MTNTFKGVDKNLVPPPIGIPSADKVTLPLWLGDQEQVRTIFGDTPVVDLLTQPAILFPLARKIIFDAVETFTDIAIGVLYTAVVAPPLSVIVLNEPVESREVIVKS